MIMFSLQIIKAFYSLSWIELLVSLNLFVILFDHVTDNFI